MTVKDIRIPVKDADRNAISRRTNVTFNILFVVACAFVLTPIWLIIAASISQEQALVAQGYGLLPRGFSLRAYEYLFSRGSMIGTAYKNTILATVCGTALSVTSVCLYAYPLSRPDFKYRNFFSP